MNTIVVVSLVTAAGLSFLLLVACVVCNILGENKRD